MFEFHNWHAFHIINHNIQIHFRWKDIFHIITFTGSTTSRYKNNIVSYWINFNREFRYQEIRYEITEKKFSGNFLRRIQKCYLRAVLPAASRTLSCLLCTTHFLSLGDSEYSTYVGRKKCCLLLGAQLNYCQKDISSFRYRTVHKGYDSLSAIILYIHRVYTGHREYDTTRNLKMVK